MGTNPRSEREELGVVRGGTLFPSGAVLLSDRAKVRLVYVDSAGAAVVVGRQGSGPTEFRQPTTVVRLDEATTIVLDRALARILFLKHVRGSPTITSTVTLRRIPDQICAFGPRLFALRFDAVSGTILHSVSLDGEERSSFGSPLFDAGPRVNNIATQGHLLCLTAPQLVIVAPSLKPEVRAYDAPGTLRWARTISGVIPPVVKEVAGGGVLFGHPPGLRQSHSIASLVQIGSEHILVQFGLTNREHPGDNGDFVGIDSRILRVSDGAEVGRQIDLPFVLASDVSRLLILGPDPEPWIEVRKYQLTKHD